MCLLALAWLADPDFPLVIAANRDEAHQRPSTPLQEWPDAPGVYGGRDLLEGGSWMALAESGRLAAVTNVREPLPATQPRSRGQLVREFLLGDSDANSSALQAVERGDGYRPFNLLLWDGRALAHATNRPRPARRLLESGVHGVSNGSLDAPWPKVRWAVDGMQRWIGTLTAGNTQPDVEPLFTVLASEQRAPFGKLPDTGVDLQTEHRLSAPFIRGEIYGTRTSTVVLVHRTGVATLIERSFGVDGASTDERRLTVRLRRV